MVGGRPEVKNGLSDRNIPLSARSGEPAKDTATVEMARKRTRQSFLIARSVSLFSRDKDINPYFKYPNYRRFNF